MSLAEREVTWAQWYQDHSKTKIRITATGSPRSVAHEIIKRSRTRLGLDQRFDMLGIVGLVREAFSLPPCLDDEACMSLIDEALK